MDLVTPSTPDVYTYFDYRQWMKDAQKAIKTQRKAFTLEFIAHKVGLRSKGHITLIIQGHKNIPVRLVESFGKVFGLDADATKFFSALVSFNHARTHRDKKTFLDRMVALQGKVNKRLVPEQYELCQHWYYPVIRELIRIVKVKEDWAGLARLVRPRITGREARDAVTALERMGLACRDPNGYLQQTEAVLSFGDGWRSVAVREFQHQTFDLAKNALDEVAPEAREISSVTMSISNARFAQLKLRLQEFREEVLGLIRTDDDPEKVFQLNLSLFPLSRSEKEAHVATE